MTTQATGKFAIKSWDEKPYAELAEGGKLTRASVTQAFQGDIDADGALEYLMAYRPDGTAEYVGLARIEGRLGGRSGSFVLRLTGGFENGLARAQWSVVTGAGTGGLQTLRGQGGFDAVHGQSEVPYYLEYDLE